MTLFFERFFKSTEGFGFWVLLIIVTVVSILELAFELYERKWKKNEGIIDILCFIAPFIMLGPVLNLFCFWLASIMFPHGKNMFSWIPFGWALFIIAITDDLTSYWIHRFHHEFPSLWRFHRTHHSAPYMGIVIANRGNFLFNIYFLFVQSYLIMACTYFGLGMAAVAVAVFRILVSWAAHSSIPWDKPFYKYKVLHPFAWVLERVISTPATHYAHHADTNEDGIGHYNGNYATVFFIWDIIFKTGKITRRYPERIGLKHYKQEEWYVQLLWPIFKSKKEGSELAKNAPVDKGDMEI